MTNKCIAVHEANIADVYILQIYQSDKKKNVFDIKNKKFHSGCV